MTGLLFDDPVRSQGVAPGHRLRFRYGPGRAPGYDGVIEVVNEPDDGGVSLAKGAGGESDERR